jgi:hypothetical protein
MARKPLDIANINLRIRESLRAKLAREAERNRTSLNNEIRLRLEDSLEKGATSSLDDIAADMKAVWARYGERFLCLGLEADLAEALAQSTDPKVATLARAWLHTRGRAQS